MPETVTLNVRGQKLRTRTRRRYIVVAVRPVAVQGEGGTFVAFASILKRSDNIDTARNEKRKYNNYHGAFAVIMDRITGEEI